MIPKEKWSELIDGLRDTIIDRASVKSDRGTQNNTAEVHARRAKIRGYLSSMNSLRFSQSLSDQDFWLKAATKPFYAGHLASAVQSCEKVMLTYLGNRAALCSTDWDGGGRLFKKFMKDEGCFKHDKCLQKVITAARRIERLKSFRPKLPIFELLVGKLPNYTSTESLRTIYEKLNGHLKFGPVTTFHLMTELGLPVIKPDRVLVRTSVRLGLIEKYKTKTTTKYVEPSITNAKAVALGQNRDFCWALQDVFQKISDETQVSMRALDFTIAKLGMEPDARNGFVRTICPEKKPLCGICSAQKLCAYAELQRRR